MLDLRIIADGHPCTPLELPLKIGRAAAVAEISDQIEALIATLDRLDGDSDIEEDDPPGGDPNDEGEIDEGRLMPVYGIDQRRGPVNFGDALCAYLTSIADDGERTH